jgi:ubiquinone/menaquinone biosynthesis C-methylase UbiE
MRWAGDRRSAPQDRSRDGASNHCRPQERPNRIGDLGPGDFCGRTIDQREVNANLVTPETVATIEQNRGADPAYADMLYRDRFWPSRRYEDSCDRIALRAMLPPAGGRMIEIGAGFGRLADEYTGYDSVVLLDLSGAQIQAARERLREDSRYEVVEGDAFNLRFPDASFDAVVCIRVIHHFEDPRPAIAEMARVLKPGGTLVLECGNKRNLKAIGLYWLRRRKTSPFRRGSERAPDVHFLPDAIRNRLGRKATGPAPAKWEASTDFDHSPVDFRGWVRDAGFRIEASRSVSNFRLPFITRHIPLGVLSTLERALQSPLASVTLGPSVVVRATRVPALRSDPKPGN